jgi:hypothetical protein
MKYTAIEPFKGTHQENVNGMENLRKEKPTSLPRFEVLSFLVKRITASHLPITFTKLKFDPTID